MPTTDEILLRGRVFAITEVGGDIPRAAESDELYHPLVVPIPRTEEGPYGLFVDDTRILSRLELSVDAFPMVPLFTENSGFRRDVTLMPAMKRDAPPAYSAHRTQALHDDGMAESVWLTNHTADPLTVTVRYFFTADFADQFELRNPAEAFTKPGAEQSLKLTDHGFELRYRREDYRALAAITAQPRAVIEMGGNDRKSGAVISWTVLIPASGTTELRYSISASEATGPGPIAEEVANQAHEEDRKFFWPAYDKARIAADSGLTDDLDRACARGIRDLGLLRVPAPGRPDLLIPGAGVPWFLTLFGRDSVLASYFALPYLPDLAEATLRALADCQGREFDPFRGEEPGKIAHEMRIGELSRFGQLPFGQYYGSVDSTPLFLVLLSEHRLVTGSDAVATELEATARAAVDWMFTTGGLGDDGYLRYSTVNDAETGDGNESGGLVQQCWKDSPDSIRSRDGLVASGDVAVCEAQGYAYDALVRTAEIARKVWRDEPYATKLTEAATKLRERFHRDFWLEKDEFFALALNGDGTVLDAPSSNPGHLLWSRILTESAGDLVAKRLAGPDFFSGWGIRTLAAGQPSYHPLSYHRGSVWPHDTGIAIAGMVEYGRDDLARTVAAGLLTAASRLDYRLPEVFAGFGRDERPGPVPFPHSCSPQAWAAATPLLLRTVLYPPE